MATVGILGGGISGLSCAYYLKTLGKSKVKYIFLLDRNPKFGGWIQTTRFPDGAIFEHGPRTLRVGTKAGFNALELADHLGLSSRILQIDRSHPTAKTNFILANNRLNPVPRQLFDFFKKMPPLSKSVMSYIIKEVSTKPEHLDDETIYDFAKRRLDENFAKYLLDPMCRGITAGDVRQLSVRSTFPTLYEAELKHGSVVKGLFSSNKVLEAGEFINSKLVKRAYDEVWRMWTLKSGLSELIDTLAGNIDERGSADLIFNANCSSLTFKEGKAEIGVENENIVVDHVFSSIPSQNLSALLTSYPDLKNSLNSISAVDVAVVYLEFEGAVLKEQGFGFLAPSFEDSKVLGIVFDSCCFPELNGRSKTRLTCMLGGQWFNELFGKPELVSEHKILEVAVTEACRHLRITEKPVRSKVLIEQKCIPQYVLGHYKKLQTIDEEITKHNLPLSLIGASYKGAGVPDCIYNARLSAEKFLKSF